MGSILSGPKPTTIIQAAAPSDAVTKPTALPTKPEDSVEARRQQQRIMAEANEAGTSRSETELTSKLGDSTKAYKRTGTTRGSGATAPAVSTIVG